MMTMFSPRESGDKKIKIMSAAAKVFSEKGFHQAKMEEIAQRAEVGKGTVYEYFSSKQDLFTQMFQAGCQFYHQMLQEALQPGMTVREKLEKVVFLQLEFILKHQDIGLVMKQECFQLGDEMKTFFQMARQSQIELLTGIFQEGINQGLFRQINCLLTARLFIGACNDVARPAVYLAEGMSLSQLSAEIVDVFLRGVQK